MHKFVYLSAGVIMIDIDEGFFKTTSLSTAGAISVRDSKGRLVTQKVKVRRYAAGKLYEEISFEKHPAFHFF